MVEHLLISLIEFVPDLRRHQKHFVETNHTKGKHFFVVVYKTSHTQFSLSLHTINRTRTHTSRYLPQSFFYFFNFYFFEVIGWVGGAVHACSGHDRLHHRHSLDSILTTYICSCLLSCTTVDGNRVGSVYSTTHNTHNIGSLSFAQCTCFVHLFFFFFNLTQKCTMHVPVRRHAQRLFDLFAISLTVCFVAQFLTHSRVVCCRRP